MKCCINNGSWKNSVRRMIPDQLHNKTLLLNHRSLKRTHLVNILIEDSKLCVDYLTSRDIPYKHWKDMYFVESAQSLSSINYKYNKRVLGNDPRLVLPFYDRQKNLIGVTGRGH